MPGPKHLLPLGLILVSATTATAHLSYAGRNFGTFSGLEPQSVTITGQTAPNSWGWADGTDADFAHTHEQRYFRFTLQQPSRVTLAVGALDPVNMFPGYSIYAGVGKPNEYESDITIDYLATLPGPTKEGAFNALGTWKMGSDSSTSFDQFSTFTYVSNAADGSATNFGDAPGINGDGMADGHISATFQLDAGDYTVVIGGADYYTQDSTTARAIRASVTVVPEPSAAGLAVLGSLGLLCRRERRSRSLTAS